MSIQSYYNLRRVETARELLRDRELSIEEIAEYLQYSSVHSFSKAFKNAAGISPGAYRRLARRGPPGEKAIDDKNTSHLE